MNWDPDFRRMWSRLAEDIDGNSNYIIVDIDTYLLQPIRDFAYDMIPYKIGEQHIYDDCNKLWKRWYTGRLGEVAVAGLIGKDFVDWKFGKKSIAFGYPDLEPIGIRCGVKSVEIGKFPLVPAKPEHPEIIAVITRENRVIVCGLADVEALSDTDDEKVIDPNIDLDYKTAFVGFDKLKQFKNIGELEDLIGE